MRQQIEKSPLLFSLPLAVGVVLCVLGLASVPATFAQLTNGSTGMSPATARSTFASGPFHAVPDRLPPATPRPRIRHAELRRRYEIAPALQHPDPGLSASERWGALRDEVVAPGFLVGSFAIGLSDHLTDDPSTWRGNATGYALRVGSTAGRLLIEAGVTHGIAAATRLDPRFVPHRTGGVGSRLRHAVLSAVTARTSSGTRMPNVPRLAGTYGAALFEQQWTYRETRFRSAAYTLALSVGIDVAVNVITEFVGSR